MKKNFRPVFLNSPEGEGGGGGGTLSAEDKIVTSLKNKIAEEVRSLSKSDDYKKVIETIFNDQILANMDATQLRGYADNDTKLKADILELSSKIEKIEQRGLGVVPKLVGASGSVIKEALNTRFADMEAVLKARSEAKEFVLNVRAGVLMTTENVVEAADEIPEDLIDSYSISAFVEKRRDREYIFDIADRTTVGSLVKYKTWLSEGDEEGAFAIVQEGGLKEKVSAGLKRNISEAEKIAGKSVYNDEVPKFKKEAYQIIRRLINDKLMRDFQSILTARLVAAAAPYVASALDDQYESPTDYHAIAAVAAQIEALNFYPDILVLNPQDKWRIGMSQDTTGAFYLSVPTVSPEGEQRILGFRVITSNKIPVGKFILGEAKLWKIEDETITIKIGYGIENIYGDVTDPTKVTKVEHDLDHNRFRIIAETWFHSYIDSLHTGSFVYGDFAVIKEAVKKTP